MRYFAERDFKAEMKETFPEILNDLIVMTGLSKRQVAILCHITTSQMTTLCVGHSQALTPQSVLQIILTVLSTI